MFSAAVLWRRCRFTRGSWLLTLPHSLHLHSSRGPITEQQDVAALHFHGVALCMFASEAQRQVQAALVR